MKNQRAKLKAEVEYLKNKIMEAQNRALISELREYKESDTGAYIYEVAGGMGSLSVKVYGKRKVFEVFAYDVLRPNNKWVSGRRLFKELQGIVCYYQNLDSYYYPETV